MRYVEDYYDNIELPAYYKDEKLIKFKGLKINGKFIGLCIFGYINNYSYYYKEVNFINYKKSGPYKIYNEFGKLYEEGIYENDLKNGPYKIYLDGNLYEEGIYINDIKMALIKDII